MRQQGQPWISTDGNAPGSNGGLFAVPVDGRGRGHVKQSLTMPVGGKTCGPVVRDELVAGSVQHPGELDGASADNPMPHWPDGDSQPRPSVVAAVYPTKRWPGSVMGGLGAFVLWTP